MMNYLKQSTTTTIQFGPFLDDTDGKTAETALTLTSTDFWLSKGGAAFANPNDINAGTHDRAGWYRKQINATDTATIGRLIIHIHETGALPVWREFMIVPANVYDSLIAGTDSLEVDVLAISGDTGAADNLELDYDGTGYNKANSTIGTTTVNTDMVGAAPTVVQNRQEIDNNSTQLAAIAGDTAELQTNQGNWLTAVGFSTHSAADVQALLNDLASAEVAAAVWNALLTSYQAAGSFGEEVQAHALSSEISGLNNITAADVWAVVTRTLTAGTKDTEIDSILGDTAELQGNQGNWLTAVGFSTHAAADVQALLNDLSGTEIAAAIWDALLASYQDVGSMGEAMGDAGGAGTPPTVVEIRQEMDSNSTQFAAIVGDTAELQVNQGNWLTAVGFSTHAAADVQALLNDLSSAEIAAAVWDALLASYQDVGSMGEAMGDAGGAGTPPTVVEIRQEMDLNSTKLIDIVGDTAELQTNQGNWLTAAGFSTHAAADVQALLNDITAADVWAVITRTLTAGTKDAEIDAILGDTAELQGNQGNWLTATGFSTHSAADVQALLNDLTGAEIAAAVWNALLASYQIVGSMGEALDDAATGDGVPPTVTQIRQEMDLNSTKLIDILGDTAELQADDVPGLIAALNDPTVAAIAAAVLSLGVTGVEDTAEVLSLAGVILAQFRGDIDELAGTMIVRKSDRLTVFSQENITVDVDALPITSVGQT